MTKILLFAAAVLTPGLVGAGPGNLNYPEARRVPVADTFHGTVLVDNYRWLENSADSTVLSWTAAQNQLSRSFLDSLPQRRYFVSRLTELRRIDKQGMPFRVPDGAATFYWRQARDQEKPVSYVREHESLPERIVLDENELDPDEQLLSFSPSRDGRYVALGIAQGGSEDARIRVMERATGEFLPDALRGTRHSYISWVPDNVGFYYTAAPQPGTVPAGDEAYWHTVYFHRLGTQGDQD
jgi:prolyl oligopeptidase